MLRVVSVNETSVTIQWEPVDCVQRNGRITQYQIAISTGDITLVEATTIALDRVMTFSATGLLPHTNYTFMVRAFNSDISILGPSASINVSTSLPQG